MADFTDLASTVQQRRKQLRISQKTLADLAGCHFMFVSDLEQGKRTLQLDKVLAILKVLGLRGEIVDD